MANSWVYSISAISSTHTHAHMEDFQLFLSFSVSHKHLLSSCVPGLAGGLGFSVITAVNRELSFAWQMVQHHAASGNRDNHLPPRS